jgi:MFS family permease
MKTEILCRITAGNVGGHGGPSRRPNPGIVQWRGRPCPPPEVSFIVQGSGEVSNPPGSFPTKAHRIMNRRNRIGLYGSYFFGMAGIGFTLPYLPLYLGQEGLSDRAIGLISTLAALAGLAQFPVGLWSDRIGRRKPFLLVSLALVAFATAALRGHHHAAWLAVLVVLFAENGFCRAVIESLAGAEAAALAKPGQVGAALGALRFWKPIGIVAMAMAGSLIAERGGTSAILIPLAAVQALGFVAALLIDEDDKSAQTEAHFSRETAPAHKWLAGKVSTWNGAVTPDPALPRSWLPSDPALWVFMAAMVLFHVANAPGGVYLGLFLNRDLHASDRMLAYAFVVSMAAWMLVVWPAGWLADRWGRKPLLVASWAIMAARLAIVSVVHTPTSAIANQAFDGLANGLFAVLAGAWMTDRLADSRRSGEAQVIVGSCLVLGSAIGPAVAGLLVGPLGYRGLFAALAAVGALATAIVAIAVPETLPRLGTSLEGTCAEPAAAS